ncbi:MAG: methyl-accepting chemotaxis protein [Beijerinckiaceae bacterium]|nr:methyl-accepting chemotaxis protein [Beijerinckiaceae bacterium]
MTQKLAVGFGTLILIAVASSAYVYRETFVLSAIEKKTASSTLALNYIDSLSGELNTGRAAVQKYMLTGAAADQKEIAPNFAQVRNDLDALKNILDVDAPQFRSELLEYRNAVIAYIQGPLSRQEALVSDPSTHLEAIAIVGSADTKKYADVVDRAFDKLRGKVAPWSDGWTVESAHAMDATKAAVVVSGVISLILGLALCWITSRAIGRPMTAMTNAMRALAGGDRSVVVPARDQKDEIGEMAQAVQIFKEAAVAKFGLEQEAAVARAAAEEDRSRHEAIRAETARQMSQVVEGLAAGLDKLASGDLVNRIDRPFATEYESLRANFNVAVAQLQETIEVVSANTGAILSGSGQISTASDELSRRTEQQAASIEETAATLSEITTAVKRTADGAAHARELVRVASADAEQSGKVVTRTVDAMGGIDQSSQKIGDIIGVIDEIAFQTNLLALNAGVEAARAGEAGRGFAVVASEVRALAQRSAEAAKEIKSLVLASNEQVKAGVQLVGDTGKSLTRIVEQVTEISAIVSEIANSAQDQANGLSQINIAVMQMDKVTQQNAAMVEESTAATHSLASDGEELARAVGRFRLAKPSQARFVQETGTARAVG